MRAINTIGQGITTPYVWITDKLICICYDSTAGCSTAVYGTRTACRTAFVWTATCCCITVICCTVVSAALWSRTVAGRSTCRACCCLLTAGFFGCCLLSCCFFCRCLLTGCFLSRRLSCRFFFSLSFFFCNLIQLRLLLADQITDLICLLLGCCNLGFVITARCFLFIHLCL